MSSVLEAVDSFLAETRLLEADDKLHQLILKAGEKDQDAFSRLYGKYIGLLTTVAKRNAKGRAVNDIDDIVQETFLKFYEKELGKFAQRVQAGERKPEDLRPLLIRATKNATIDANRKSGFRGSIESPMGSYDPKGKLTGKHLGDKAKKVVRAAYKRALAKAKLNDNERKFVMALFGGVTFKVPNKGEIMKTAAAIWSDKPKSSLTQFANRAKTRFLKFFCTDKELCALLPHFKGELGRAKAKSKLLPGLGAGNACKDHACEEVQFLSNMGEDITDLDQGGAQDLVVAWIEGFFLQD